MYEYKRPIDEVYDYYFNSRAKRRTYLKIVYLLFSLEMIAIFAGLLVVYFVDQARFFVQEQRWIGITCFVIWFVLFFLFYFFDYFVRTFPLNYIFFFISILACVYSIGYLSTEDNTNTTLLILEFSYYLSWIVVSLFIKELVVRRE